MPPGVDPALAALTNTPKTGANPTTSEFTNICNASVVVNYICTYVEYFST
jgi:hypothetical protein